MKFEQVCCNLCGSESTNLLYAICGYTIVKCKNCSLVYLNPRPSQSDVYSLYNSDYFVGAGFDPSANYFKEAENPPSQEIERLIQKIRLIQKRKGTGRLLDVGCGAGLFLNVAKNEGFKVEGADISFASSDFCKNKFSIPVQVGELEKINFRNLFDVIHMEEVIEHLPNPKKTLSKIYELLDKDGIIVIQTGNIRSLKAKIAGKNWDYFRLPGHIYYFSPQTLCKLLEIAGFKIQKVIPPHDFEDSRMFKKLIAKGICPGIVFTIFKKLANKYDELLSPGMIIIAQK